MVAPSGFNPAGSGGVGGGGGQQNKPKHRSTEPEPGPVTYGSSSTGPEVGGVMPIVNPSVNPSVIGGRVDPAQISGRTASTSTSAAESPLKMGPPGSVGQMGGMGGAPLGGVPGGGGSGGGRPNITQPRRDRESERILTGEEARDKALISHILRDDDPVAGEFVDAADVLADMLPDDRNPAPPQYAEPPQASARPTLREPIPQTPLREPTPPKPPAPQYPGEPRDDELW